MLFNEMASCRHNDIHKNALSNRQISRSIGVDYSILKMMTVVAFLVFPARVICQETGPKIGLVLSGGGARGSAHLGVLKALEEMRIPIHVITGTSMGAIMGGLYSSGLSIDEMQTILADTDWREVLEDRPARRLLPYRKKVDDQTFLTRLELGVNRGSIQLPPGMVTGQKLNFVLQRMVLRSAGIQDFNQLPIPFAAVATDIETGDMVVMRAGDLGLAIRASMSIPGVFSPVKRDGKLLVDGGLVRNLPVDVAIAMGADVIIAVDVGEPLFKQDELGSMTRVTNQMLSIPFRKNVDEQLHQVTVLIKPDCGDFKSSQFDRGIEMVPVGEAATYDVSKQLEPFMLDAETFQRHIANIRMEHPLLERFESIQLTADSTSNSKRLFERITIRPGDAFSLDAIESDLRNLYETGDYERVDFYLKKGETGYQLYLEAHDKKWGPNYLRFGVNFVSDFAGESTFDVLTSYNMTHLNSRRGEVKLRAQIGETPTVLGEYYQPLSRQDNWFGTVTALLQTSSSFVFQDNGLYAPYDVSASRGSAYLGYQFSRYGEVRFGPTFTRVLIEPSDGDAGYSELTTNATGLQLTATFDQFDNMNFPRQGSFFVLDFFDARESWGSDVDYQHLIGFAGMAMKRGRHSVLSLTNFYSALGSDTPEVYSLGGLFNLSGYPKESVIGRYGGKASLLYLYQLFQLPQTIGDGFFVGGSLEAGNLWTERSGVDGSDLLYSASLFIGFDTILGPVYFAKGMNDDSNSELYLFVGRSF